MWKNPTLQAESVSQETKVGKGACTVCGCCWVSLRHDPSRFSSPPAPPLTRWVGHQGPRSVPSFSSATENLDGSRQDQHRYGPGAQRSARGEAGGRAVPRRRRRLAALHGPHLVYNPPSLHIHILLPPRATPDLSRHSLPKSALRPPQRFHSGRARTRAKGGRLQTSPAQSIEACLAKLSGTIRSLTLFFTLTPRLAAEDDASHQRSTNRAQRINRDGPGPRPRLPVLDTANHACQSEAVCFPRPVARHRHRRALIPPTDAGTLDHCLCPPRGDRRDWLPSSWIATVRLPVPLLRLQGGTGRCMILV